MKNNQTKDKILSQIKDGKLFNKKLPLAVEHLFKENHSKISRSKIRASISTLNKDGKILIKDNKIVSDEKFFTGVYISKKFGGVIEVEQDNTKTEYRVTSSQFKNIPHKTVVGFIKETSNDKNLAHIASIISFNENSLYGNVKLNKKGEIIFVPDFNPYRAKFTLENNDYAKQAIDKKCKVKINNISLAKNKIDVVIETKDDIFGNTLSPLAHIDAVLREEGITRGFDKKVLKEADALPSNISEADLVGRKDYRHLNFVTIDPETAKDMDDATYIEKITTPSGETEYKYYIAIADISHYVPEGSAMDKEAFNRSFSLYPAGGVVPMFPEKLSNDICSLKENEDRLAMVTEITYDDLGNVKNYSFFNGVINSKQKFSYEFVQNIKEKKAQLDPSQKHTQEMLETMYELTEKIEVLKKEQGTISLSGYQPTIILNETKDDVVDFVNKNNLYSTKIIEKAMVANNVAVANFLKQLNVPILSREHDYPLPQRFEDFANFMYFLGLDIGYLEPTNQAYNDIIDLIKGHYLESVMSSKLVRSMQKAKYTNSPDATHFALDEKDYTHFTAGIRRYLDITVHRTLKKVLTLYNQAVKNNLLDKDLPMSENISQFSKLYKTKLENIVDREMLGEIALYINEKEELSNKIETKTNAICAALYMRKHIGQTFSAYVSSVEKDHIIATLKDEDDAEHSDIIEVVLPLKELIKNKKVFTDPKNSTVTEHQTAKMLYYAGKQIEVIIKDVDLVEGKTFAKDDYILKHENQKNNNSQKNQANEHNKKQTLENNLEQ